LARRLAVARLLAVLLILPGSQQDTPGNEERR
jgi:hypothetical protein